MISESTITYITMLFTNQSGIKPPKNSGSNDIEKIFDGCKNQAWDLNYLSNWSSFHYNEKNMDDIFMFATNDILLKNIFINTYADGGVGALINTLFSKAYSQKIFEIINANQGSKRVKSNFGLNPKEYFRQLINQEKQKLQDTLGSYSNG
ncbi:hypothetical protein [Clostridium botulinum]|nr:hypothetical protein RSJ10_1028 [Clostridium botulinum]